MDLRLSGRLDGRALELLELSGATQTGAFRGSVGDDGKIAGTWSKPTDATALPFALEPIARAAETRAALVYKKTLRDSRRAGWFTGRKHDRRRCLHRGVSPCTCRSTSRSRTSTSCTV
jgi:hypothetical protein